MRTGFRREDIDGLRGSTVLLGLLHRTLGGVWGALRRRYGRLPATPGAGRDGDLAARWAALDQALTTMADQPERERLRPSGSLTAVRALAERGELAVPPAEPAEPTGRPGAEPTGTAGWSPAHEIRIAQVRTVTRRLIRQNRYQPAQDILGLVLTAWDPDPLTGLQALAAHAATSLTGQPSDDLVAVAEAALQGADRAWAAGDAVLAAELIVIGAGLLLHRDLHADVEHSPLADDPESFLAPVRRSTAMRALRSPVAGEPDMAGSERRVRHVVVLPGTYPRFAAPLIGLLRRQPGLRVDVVDLPEVSPALRWLGTDPDLVRLRLLATRGDLRPDEFGVTAEVRDLVRRADVVVADWGDRGAMWASLVTPTSTRLVVRLHGMDSLSLWVHTLDWSRVDELVTVSPHHAALSEQILRRGAVPPQERLPRCGVVPNVISLRTPSTTSPPEREPHTLGMVGWGKRVKDPLWAVEVLAGLRRRGGDWRLRLVGDGFRPGGVVTSEIYAQRFEDRIGRADVAGAIELVPQTDDVADEVARLGFVLSASRRESFHLGLVEGVLGGAVPVVRDWPFYARHGGAALLFPQDWVVPDLGTAVERIWRLRGEPHRAAAAERARLEVASRFDPEQTEQLLLRAVLGGSASSPARLRAAGGWPGR